MFTHNIEISRYCHSDGRKYLAVPLKSPSARCFALLSMTLIIGVNINIIIKITY